MHTYISRYRKEHSCAAMSPVFFSRISHLSASSSKLWCVSNWTPCVRVCALWVKDFPLRWWVELDFSRKPSSKIWWKNPLLLGTRASKAAPKRSTSWGNFCRLIFLGLTFWDWMYLWMVICMSYIYIYRYYIWYLYVMLLVGIPIKYQGTFMGIPWNHCFFSCFRRS